MNSHITDYGEVHAAWCETCNVLFEIIEDLAKKLCGVD